MLTAANESLSKYNRSAKRMIRKLQDSANVSKTFRSVRTANRDGEYLKLTKMFVDAFEENKLILFGTREE
ncbi:hypothetical protein SUGI_0322310 [Cryptomeria japonica]|nr:hypothetical protein SUGI_0322310 [Cryptomeria japonica]